MSNSSYKNHVQQNLLNVMYKGAYNHTKKKNRSLKSNWTFRDSCYDGTLADDFNFFGGGFPPEITTYV